MNTRQKILEKAISCVVRERNDQYGNPEDSFKIITKLWNAYLDLDDDSERRLSEKDVAAMMILLKIARMKNGKSHLDNWVDIAGYAACGGEIEELIESESLEQIPTEI